MREDGRAPPPFRPSLPAVPRGQFSIGPRRPLPLHSGADCARDAHETGFLHHPPADGACICAADPSLEPVTRRQTPLSVYQVCPSDRIPELSGRTPVPLPGTPGCSSRPRSVRRPPPVALRPRCGTALWCRALSSGPALHRLSTQRAPRPFSLLQTECAWASVGLREAPCSLRHSPLL